MVNIETNAKIVTEEKGLQDIFSAMENHSQNAELIENACAALWSLSMEGQWSPVTRCLVVAQRVNECSF